MASQQVPRGSVLLSPEDAQALFAVINRTSGTINWVHVANDIGTAVEVARERYTRVLSNNSAVGLPALTNNSHTAAGTSSNASNDTTTTTIATSIPTPTTDSSNPANAAFNGEAEEGSISPNVTATTPTPHITKISDLRPCVLPRLTGLHRVCCFYGYRWCCYAEGCVKHTQCGYDLRVHFRKDHRGQAGSFDFARLVHRAQQEAESWAEGEVMDEDWESEEGRVDRVA